MWVLSVWGDCVLQQDFSHVEGTDDNPAQQLGLQLTYNLQAIQFIDQLREYHDKGNLHQLSWAYIY